MKDRLIKHGLPDTFVADLKDLVEKFGEAILRHRAGRDEQTAAPAGMASALSPALTSATQACETLDHARSSWTVH